MKKILISFILVLASSTILAQYNPNLNPFESVQEAAHKAKINKKHIFVSIGGDWCIWCKRFTKTLQENDSLTMILKDNYEHIYVNYSKENKNLVFLNQYGNPQRFGFPVFMILDEHGKLLHIQNSAYLEDGKNGHDVKKIKGFLKDWTYKATHQIVD